MFCKGWLTGWLSCPPHFSLFIDRQARITWDAYSEVGILDYPKHWTGSMALARGVTLRLKACLPMPKTKRESRSCEESNIKAASQLRKEPHVCSTQNSSSLNCFILHTCTDVCFAFRGTGWASAHSTSQHITVTSLPVKKWDPAEHILWTSYMLFLLSFVPSDQIFGTLVYSLWPSGMDS